ncbi:MAG: hypothetical protein ABI193_03295, partial [Minicystis sp.]
VRSKNAAAGGFIAASAGVLLFCSIAHTLISSVMSSALRGAGDVVMAYALLNVTMAIFRAVGSVLLIVGIVKLANGAPLPNNPYR